MAHSSRPVQPRGLERLIAWSLRHRLTLDIVGAAFALFFCLLFLPALSGSTARAIGYLVAMVATCVALVLRRRWPLVAVLIWLAAMILHVLLGQPGKPLPLDWVSPAAMLATLAAAYTVQAQLPHHTRPLFVIALVLGPVAAAVRSGDSENLLARSAGVVLAWALIAVFSLLGVMRRIRRQELDRAVAHAALLQAQQDQQIELATLDERTRLAREMHDTVAHSLGVVIAQADGGRYAVLADPHAGKESLDSIAKVARQSLAEMRRLVGTLRNEDRELAAAPKASDIPTLVDDFRRAGLWVRHQEEGSMPAELAPTLSLTIYRLVQQSLSNALKHGTTRPSAQLTIEWTDELFILDVTNPMPEVRQAPDEAPGHGLIGMLERARMLGGTLTAGPTNGEEPSQWRVRAELPMQASEVQATNVPPVDRSDPGTRPVQDVATTPPTTTHTEGRTDD